MNRQSLTWTAVIYSVLLVVLVCPTVQPGSPAAATCSHTAAPFCWPTSVSANGRYLLDQTGQPYMMVGDSPQSLIGQLSPSEANAYFANRQAHGINSVWINLVCTWYTGCGIHGTYDGIEPFNGPNSNPFANPNPVYFQRANEIIKLAADHGITVFLDPAETGGWISEIDAAAPRTTLTTVYTSADDIRIFLTLSGSTATISKPGTIL